MLRTGSRAPLMPHGTKARAGPLMDAGCGLPPQKTVYKGRGHSYSEAASSWAPLILLTGGTVGQTRLLVQCHGDKFCSANVAVGNGTNVSTLLSDAAMMCLLSLGSGLVNNVSHCY